MKKKLFLVFFASLPSSLKVMILRWMGHSIGKNVHIGFLVYLDVRNISLGSRVKIAGFNYFKNLQRLEMADGARIGGWGNWFTASRFNYEGNAGFGTLIMEENAGITGRHYFDLCETVTIGAETLVAGFHSVFYTHGYTPETTNVNRPIRIGSKGYVGSHCIFLPGSVIGDCSFVGAGAVVTRDLSAAKYVLIGGNPAVVKKTYDPSCAHFTRKNDYVPRLRHIETTEAAETVAK